MFSDDPVRDAAEYDEHLDSMAMFLAQGSSDPCAWCGGPDNLFFGETCRVCQAVGTSERYPAHVR